MRLIEAARRNAVGIVLAGSATIGFPSLAAIGDGIQTANAVNSIIPIVRLAGESTLPPTVDPSTAAFINVAPRDLQSLANEAEDVQNYSLFHRNDVKDIIEAIRHGEDSTLVLGRLNNLLDLAYKEMAIGALGFVGTSVVVEAATNPKF